MKHTHLSLQLLLFFSFIRISIAESNDDSSSSIVFATLGRAQYAFDIFTLPIPIPNSISNHPTIELQITDGQSVNYNGFFPNPSSSILSLLPTPLNSQSQPLIFISERNGSSNIYLNSYTSGVPNENRRSTLQTSNQFMVPLLGLNEGQVSMKDRPSVAGDHLIYVSTHEKTELPRKSWAAVYSTHLKTMDTQRLTPPGVADFSPAVSPSGAWTAVASDGEEGWMGEIEELNTDIYVFRTVDGTRRTRVVRGGGWPSWADESTLYFHRQCDDGWWSVYRAILRQQTPFGVELVATERVTPPGLHAFTPAASRNGEFIAVATRRPTSEYRHIELFDMALNDFVEITRPVSPNAHHFNPFILPDSTRIGYHRCRGSGNSKSLLMLENLRSPLEKISLFRIDGSFPSFSPSGDQIAYVGFPGLYVVNSDGSGKRNVFSGTAFATAWDWKRKGVIYTSAGPTFASVNTDVDIISITVGDDKDRSSSSYKKLTMGGKNNAFPSPSPDGKWVVFRSGRSGYKNLYIMDAVEGEKAELRRLTEGPWTDTMCSWSPDGEWIAFASDRDNPGSGSFAIYFVHPNGTGIKKVVHSGEGGRTNHPWFSPDSNNIVFTTDLAAVSAEPISNPHHYQPYGDIFIARSDGSGIRRLTHNSYEDGTPTWGPKFMKPADIVEWPLVSGSQCEFEDCHWLSQAQGNGASLETKCGYNG